MDDEEEEGEEIDDGKIPAYPRGMLRFEVGDGRWVMKGMEYRRMEEFKLGETMLGAKVSWSLSVETR
jgi:RecQ-mediated genome instability protein 1